MKQVVRRWLATQSAKLPIGILSGIEHADIFEKAGIHITPDWFWSPILNTHEIDPALWNNPSRLLGVDCNIDGQLAFLQDICALGYVDDIIIFRLSPPRRKSMAEIMDLVGLMATIVRHIRKFCPARIVEIGAGQSTLLSALILKANGGGGYLTAIDPYPQPYLTELTDPHFNLIEKKVECVPLSFFTR